MQKFNFKFFKNLLFILIFTLIGNSYAVLKININKQGTKAIKIAVAQFSGVTNIFAKIISNDLINSGRFVVKNINKIQNNIDFNQFKQEKLEAIVYGNVSNKNGDFIVEIFVYDIWTKKSLLSKKININKKISRRAAHLISDKVYFSLLGEKSFFDANIAYISVDKYRKLKYHLEIVDSDGFNPQLVFASKEPIMSPSWSPDNDKLAYVSFTSGSSRVYIQHLLSLKKIIKLPKFDGIASSPSWHPNGKSLIFTLSKNGNQDIYQYFLNGKLKRLTWHSAIDTEGSFSPDGKSIVWTSNRNGSVQIYYKNLLNNKINKLNIPGNYNANPSFSPDGKKIILIHSELSEHKVSQFELANNDLIVLTDNILDESPKFAPNGKMVIFSNIKKDNSVLSAVATDGAHQLNLSDGSKKVREPAWSGFLYKE